MTRHQRHMLAVERLWGCGSQDLTPNIFCYNNYIEMATFWIFLVVKEINYNSARMKSYHMSLASSPASLGGHTWALNAGGSLEMRLLSKKNLQQLLTHAITIKSN